MKIYLFIFFFFSACTSIPPSARYAYEVRSGFTYKKSGDASLRADLYLPLTPGPHPAVVVVHGGSWASRTGDMEWICRSLARAGFAAMNITYRLAPAAHFPAPVDDVRDAGSWLHTHAAEFSVDPSRIAAWGYSAGANLVLMAGLDPAGGFRALVAGGTPADLTSWPDSPIVAKYLDAPYAGHERLWREASPAGHVRANSPPVFLYHGNSDDFVEPAQALTMEKALVAKGVPHELYLAPHLGHVLTYLVSQESFERGVLFLRKTL